MRRKLDQYYTPEKAVENLLDNLEFYLKGTIFEPCVGEGAISKTLTARLKKQVLTNDIDKNNPADFYLDMTQKESWEQLPEIDWVVTNPPFKNAPEIIQHSFDHCTKGVIALLRLTYLEPCANRVCFLTENPPSQLMVTQRISFTGKGCDNVTTAWFVWLKEKGIRVKNPFVFLVDGDKNV
jgi:hypothetical protein